MSQTNLPSKAKVVIVGGGVMGKIRFSVCKKPKIKIFGTYAATFH